MTPGGVTPRDSGMSDLDCPDYMAGLAEDDGRIETMASDLELVRQWIAEAQEFARTYVFEMTDEYRALIEQVEGLPRNQSGADKSYVWHGNVQVPASQP